MGNLLDDCVTHALRAAHIVGKNMRSYAVDNPGESQKVFSYLKGGSRPTGVRTEMGLHLMALEDARRAHYGPPVVTPPPPPPPTEDKLAYSVDPYSAEKYSK